MSAEVLTKADAGCQIQDASCLLIVAGYWLPVATIPNCELSIAMSRPEKS